MINLFDIFRSLATPRLIKVFSDNSTLSKVNAQRASASFHGLPKQLSPVPEFCPSRTIFIRPFDLLHELGIITIPHLNNSLRISSYWSILRYLNIFSEMGLNSLCLKEYIRSDDTHRRSVLSDDLGVGMAAFITKNYLGGRHSIDVDLALDMDSPNGIHNIYSTKPDYLFSCDDGSYLVIEAKGTQSKGDYVFKQLRRGIEQLPSLQFSNPNIHAKYIAIGTRINEIDTDVYLVDPPEKGNFRGKGKRVYYIDNKEKLDEQILLLDTANILFYCGATIPAIKLSPKEKLSNRMKFFPEREIPPDQFYSVTLEDKISGQKIEMDNIYGIRHMEIFQGVPDKLYKNLVEKSFQNSENNSKIFFDRARRNFQNSYGKENLMNLDPINTTISNNTYKIETLRRNGLYFSLEFTN